MYTPHNYAPAKDATINMELFRRDYNKVKALTKTTHERYILEIFRGMIIENAIRSEVESKRKQIQDEYKKEG